MNGLPGKHAAILRGLKSDSYVGILFISSFPPQLYLDLCHAPGHEITGRCTKKGFHGAGVSRRVHGNEVFSEILVFTRRHFSGSRQFSWDGRVLGGGGGSFHRIGYPSRKSSFHGLIAHRKLFFGIEVSLGIKVFTGCDSQGENSFREIEVPEVSAVEQLFT
jgi:hypothetical protein